MKKNVVITFTIDTADYAEPLETNEQVHELVCSMLDGDADLPKVAAVTHDGVTANWRRNY
jgi:hypothetical protein